MVENRMRLNPKQAALLIIDVQERFVPVIHDYPSILAAIRKIIRGAQVLEIPILLTEQYPVFDRSSVGISDHSIGNRLCTSTHI